MRNVASANLRAAPGASVAFQNQVVYPTAIIKLESDQNIQSNYLAIKIFSQITLLRNCQAADLFIWTHLDSVSQEKDPEVIWKVDNCLKL